MSIKNETEYNQLIQQLDEKARQLHCLYEIDRISSQFDKSTEEILPQIVDIMPTGWRFSELCKVEIQCFDHYYSSQGLVKTELKLHTDIYIDDEKIGEINVYYIKPIKSEKGIFLVDEQRLLRAIAEKISNFIRYKKLEDIAKQQIQTKSDITTNELSVDAKLVNWLKKFHLNEQEIEVLLKFPLRFKKGETIGKQGAITSYFLLLADGMTKSYLETHNRTYAFMITTPFDFIGLSSLFGNQYYFSTQALTSSLVFLIDKQTVISLIHQNQPFSVALMKWYCDSYKILFTRLNCLANKQAVGRIAETLLYLSEEIFKSNIIPSIISRKDIASLAGISTENSVRILSDFKNDGIINITATHIEIIKFDTLRTFSLAG